MVVMITKICRHSSFIHTIFFPTAPYRVNYDARNWQLLTNALKSGDYTQVPLMGRVQLLSDAFALAWTNHLDYNTALT